MKAEPNPQPESLPHDLQVRLSALRKEHGPVLYYVAEYGGVLLRPISRGELVEYELNERATDPLYARTNVIKNHAVYPGWDKLAERVSIKDVHVLYAALVSVSGLGDPKAFEADLNQMRLQTLQWDHAIIRHICVAFPAHSPLEVLKMKVADVLYLLAQAEAALGKTYDGKEFGAVIDAISGKSAKADARRRARQMVMGERVRERQRFYDWEKDYREQARNERDVSDIDKPLDKPGRP